MKYVCALLAAAVALAAENPLANLRPVTDGNVAVEPGSRPGSTRMRFGASATPSKVTFPIPSSDFTKYRSFQFSFLSDSTIRWDIQLRNASGEITSFRVQPYQGVRATASIPIAFMTERFMNNKAFKAHWLSSWRNHVDVRSIESITISMQPITPVTLEVGPFGLSETELEDSFEIAKPVVDQFGQWIPASWPGKPRSLADLRKAWAAEDAGLKAAPAATKYGGWTEKKLKATGFFRVEQTEGRWWFVDPDGHPFLSVGPDCLRTADPTRVSGREKLFANLPPGTSDTADFYSHNISLRYGTAATFENWRAKQTERLRAWGFNTVANWSDARLFQNATVPYVTNLAIGRGRGRWEGYPDVRSPDFRKAAEADALEQTRQYKADPYLIGYFIGNEPHWQNRNLIDRILNDPESTPTKDYVRGVLAGKGGDSPAAREFLLEKLSRDYFQIVCDAIRKADPNHVILGIRWAGSAPDAVLRANDVFDVFSINIYRTEPPKDQIDKIVALTKRPVLIGEFHFGAPERGYAPSLVAVRDQKERGAAYSRYVESAFSHPAIVGAHYFQFKDQPVTGRYDGENYNIGFVNQQDLPYRELIDAARATHRRIYQIHAGN